MFENNNQQSLHDAEIQNVKTQNYGYDDHFLASIYYWTSIERINLFQSKGQVKASLETNNDTGNKGLCRGVKENK